MFYQINSNFQKLRFRSGLNIESLNADMINKKIGENTNSESRKIFKESHRIKRHKIDFPIGKLLFYLHLHLTWIIHENLKRIHRHLNISYLMSVHINILISNFHQRCVFSLPDFLLQTFRSINIQLQGSTPQFRQRKNAWINQANKKPAATTWYSGVVYIHFYPLKNVII